MGDAFTAAELSFTAPALTDIFTRYAGNSVMAGIVGMDGVMHMSFRGEINAVPPRNCEEFLSLLFCLLECGSCDPLSEAYMAYRTEILRDTLAELSQVLSSMVNVKLTMTSAGSQTSTELTLTRSVTTN